MMARWLCSLTILALSFSSGCCCFTCAPSCDPCGGPTCCFRLPNLLRCCHPITWDGCCNECGPCPGQPCCTGGGGCCQDGLLAHCSLFRGWCSGCLTGCLSCGRGCGEIYCDEWKSDPPDCCDPCDQCYGEFTGPHGYCCLGPCQRILACLDGYKYCPPPVSGPWRPIFGHCSPCPGPWAGPPGCATCAGGVAPGGAMFDDGYIDGVPGPMPAQRPTAASRNSAAPNVMPSPAAPATPPMRSTRLPRAEPINVFDDNWQPPTTQAQPRHAAPVSPAQQQPRMQFSGRNPPQSANAAQVAAAKRAAKRRAYEAAGIRSANYQP